MIKLPNNHPNKDGRVCTTCDTHKSADQFTLSYDKRSFGGVSMRSKCKPCDELRKYKRFVKKTYDITYDEYEELLDSQGGKCAICESKVGNARTSRLFVDHDHTKNENSVRGLLCSSCNHGLGLFKDSPKLLSKAISYLTTDRK